MVHVWHILCLSFVVGTAQSLGGPAYSALIPTLVGPEDMGNAIALNSIQFNLARVIGPTLAGVALKQLNATWCFGLNGVSFIAVIVTLLIIHPHFVPTKSRESVLTSMKEGFHFIRNQGAMQALIVLAFMMTLLAFPLIVFLPVFAKDVFHSTDIGTVMQRASEAVTFPGPEPTSSATPPGGMFNHSMGNCHALISRRERACALS